ncbi:MAG: NADH-dependent [FeFe] hydrogenase, group A6 [Clostridia bacterium]|jgi:NADP-reducing hydrogenase subunit HndD|nr:NADH-dependent [FeFe] hydrogenase, group A6 [Clostridia bacterium]
MLTIYIDGREYKVEEGSTVLDACKEAGINIPTLCYLKKVNEIGACRMCLVEVEGARTLQTSCVLPVTDGMKIKTNTEKVREARKSNLELILSNHDRECLKCFRNGSCELQKLSTDLGVDDIEFEGERIEYPKDEESLTLVRDPNKCVLCGRCVSVCKKVQTVDVLSSRDRGFKTTVGPAFGMSLADTACIGCGQCINVCPTGALREKSSIEKVWSAINNKNLHVVFQTAPSVRVALGEEFNVPMGTSVTGKMVAAIRRMGADRVFDTNTGADLTIMEEGNELLHRLENDGVLPMITSCSPGWVNFCEHYFPEFIPNLSSCKSPMNMFGAIIKSYYAEKENIDPKTIYTVAVMPCTAKKTEINRPEMENDGLRDVDETITTREFAKMIKEARIDFNKLKDEEFDNPMGEASGAGAIFGATGGVMEAAVRTVYEKVTGERLDNFEEVRGEGTKEFEVTLNGKVLKGVVVSGTGNARRVLESVKNGEKDYQFIEVMGCPGGCIMGGGQPLFNHTEHEWSDVFNLRSGAIYTEDEKSTVRRSHENPFIKKLYDEYLGEPLGEKSHKLLHTEYTARSKY